MKRDRAVMVISGFNIRAVIAFCRWASNHEVKFHIVASSNDDAIMLTSYKKHVEIIRDALPLNADKFVEWVEVIKKKYGYSQMLVLPSTEYLNRFLLEQREKIERAGCIIPLVDKALYLTLSNKEVFERLCRSYGLEVPEKYLEIPGDFPFVAKPNKYMSEHGKKLVPHLVRNQNDLDIFLETEIPQDFFLQEYVHGRSHYLLAFVRRNGDPVIFSQENLMQQARGCSVVLARFSRFHETEMAAQYISMLRDIDFWGFIMIEVRWDEQLDRYVMIEANPRLWGPMQLSVDSQIGFFEALLEEFDFPISKPLHNSFVSSYYFWSGGINQTSQPLDYHNYSAEKFVADFPRLRSQEIFFRDDTLKLFLKENGACCGK